MKKIPKASSAHAAYLLTAQNLNQCVNATRNMANSILHPKKWLR